ncbi:exo-alpha-sialidase [Fulvivirga sedimenti]|uniref:Exo-alpha-sialidase n=1 Tax=Fulvivirga sedimenti TaxID=2879465 RepID=A0A9X1HRN2_9BACT|nr:exo-alpha-sialidase [Fulvivirga sedimenti]MCA6075524.1 exo-alpha-sialidase [Fulvivirga sedimenti]MCA6076701.1 exo-alpha-sialidase [Fulvivirga sedimenti]MCA6077829.1 exo-alpha-sialidase [Fulvivirga sedimenti]
MREILILLTTAIVLNACSGSDTAQTELSPDVENFVVSDSPSEAPNLFTDISGNTFLSWTTTRGEIAQLRYTRYLGNKQWSEIQTIAEGADWFVNWADFPSLVTSQGEIIFAHYLQKTDPGTYNYDIYLRRSADGGISWSTPFTLNEDGVPAEHGFVSMVPSGTDVFISWLDGRNTTGSHGEGAMTLRAAILGSDGTRKGEWELDNRVCDCCQTAAAITARGPVVVYRDRSENEFRDMAIVRFVNNKWTDPVLIYRDGWMVEGCPVNGPQISALENTVAIAWFTAANDKPEVKLIFSNDGGQSFNAPVRINENSPIGRVDIELIDSTRAFVTWMEGAAIRGAIVTADGYVQSRYLIASSSESRSSGFPRITRRAEEIIIAWTDPDDNVIRSAFIPL